MRPRPGRLTGSTEAGTTAAAATAAAWGCPSCRRSRPPTAGTPCSGRRWGPAPASRSGSRLIPRLIPRTTSACTIASGRRGPITSTTDLLPVPAYFDAPANYGRRMQDRELVAAVAAGDADGLAEIYDRYAEPLYTYCRFMLPDLDPMGSAAQAVQDTFIIAAAKLSGLSEPDRLRAWLHAVARNECLRQLGAADGVPARPAAGSSAPDDVMPAVTLPDDLRTKVLAACADSTPTGRAYRASVTHRAGTFGRTGFPKPAVPSGPRWWHNLRRRPRAAAAVAAAAGAVVLGGIVALLMLGGSPRTPSSPVALGGGVPTAGSSAVSSGPAASPAVTARQTTSAPPTSADDPTLGQASPSG